MLITIDNGRKTSIRVAKGSTAWLRDDPDEPLEVSDLDLLMGHLGFGDAGVLRMASSLRLVNVSLASSHLSAFYQIEGARVSFLVRAEGRLQVIKEEGREAA